MPFTTKNFSKTKSIIKEKPAPLFAPSWYPVVHLDDLEPVSIIEPSDGRIWIAGGAVIQWYQNQPVGQSDIDIFCCDEYTANKTIARIKSYNRFYEKANTKNAVTLDYYSEKPNKVWTIQIIKCNYFKTAEQIFEKFDISVCQIATDGNNFKLGPTTAQDIRRKVLRMTFPLQPTAIKRFIKYQTYGYRPVDGLYDAIMSENTIWSFDSKFGDYDDF